MHVQEQKLIYTTSTLGIFSWSWIVIAILLDYSASHLACSTYLADKQPSFKILSTNDKILLLSKGKVVHHGTLSSLEAFLLSNGFTVPPQLNSLEYAMEILNQLNSSTRVMIGYKSSRLHEIGILYNRFLKIIYRTKQLLLTNILQALGVGLVLGTIYINISFDKTGVWSREETRALCIHSHFPPQLKLCQSSSMRDQLYVEYTGYHRI
ncbi:hypothetical protein POM88_045666 [Heracleum sosnowskyi]|uniref:ABC transporter family G domain-containing protein n=1 Tax=Heracleum sosnowskyi TaxID=360622 RepID=A0AAD8H4X8_9APIA|nr:hypothetical protein POM88_045666 [Heracleum sosnowskyi]